jgi:hypothetical protein
MSGRRTVIGLLLAGVSLAAIPAHGAVAASSCHNLALSHTTKLAWLAAYKKGRHLEGLRFSTASNGLPRYYGRCGDVYYGRGDFSPVKGQHLTEKQQVAMQDGPDVFRRVAGHRWKDVSDTGGGTPCGGKFGFPRALVHLWGKRCGDL